MPAPSLGRWKKAPVANPEPWSQAPASRADALLPKTPLRINTEVRSEASPLLKGAVAQKEAEGLGRRAQGLAVQVLKECLGFFLKLW